MGRSMAAFWRVASLKVRVAALGTLATFALVSAMVIAAIPDAGGVIHGCYDNTTGADARPVEGDAVGLNPGGVPADGRPGALRG